MPHNPVSTFPGEGHRQIGQLKVENDLYEGFGVKVGRKSFIRG
jgi:hypothetical protein